MAEMTEVWGKHAHQIKAGPGSCCLFSQEHIHGSGMPNLTGKIRISMDFRIAEGMYGDLLGRKMPAGYFHLIPNRRRGRTAGAAAAAGAAIQQRQAAHLLRREQHVGDVLHSGASAALYASRLRREEEAHPRLRAV